MSQFYASVQPEGEWYQDWVSPWETTTTTNAPESPKWYLVPQAKEEVERDLEKENERLKLKIKKLLKLLEED